jgi:hypothetical protein
LLVLCILPLGHAQQSPPPAPTPSKTGEKQQHVRSSKPDKANSDYTNTQSSSSPANNLSSPPPCCTVSVNTTSNEGKKSATDWITVFTAVLAGVAVLQVGALFMQLVIISRQAKHFRNSERAWLIIIIPDKPNQMQKVKNGYVENGFGFDWKVKNCGKTPAFITKIGARFHPVKSLSELPTEPNIDIRDLVQPTEQFENGPGIGPGESLERFTLTEAKRPESVPDYDAIRKGEIYWVAYGIVEYRLSFSHESPRETHFCYLWVPGQQNPFTPSPIPREYTRQT